MMEAGGLAPRRRDSHCFFEDNRGRWLEHWGGVSLFMKHGVLALRHALAVVLLPGGNRGRSPDR